MESGVSGGCRRLRSPSFPLLRFAPPSIVSPHMPAPVTLPATPVCASPTCVLGCAGAATRCVYARCCNDPRACARFCPPAGQRAAPPRQHHQHCREPWPVRCVLRWLALGCLATALQSPEPGQASAVVPGLSRSCMGTACPPLPQASNTTRPLAAPGAATGRDAAPRARQPPQHIVTRDQSPLQM